MLDKKNIELSQTKLNRWVVFILIFFLAAMTIVYVDNVVKINSLLKEIYQLEQKSDALRIENELLKTEINILQSPERIIKIAQEELGMKKPTSPPEHLP